MRQAILASTALSRSLLLGLRRRFRLGLSVGLGLGLALATGCGPAGETQTELAGVGTPDEGKTPLVGGAPIDGSADAEEAVLAEPVSVQSSSTGLPGGGSDMVGPAGLSPELAAQAMAAAPTSHTGSTLAKDATTEDLLAKEFLTFGDLALGDEALDQLLDVLLDLEEFPAEPFEFPEAIEGLRGKEITIMGYMIPTKWEKSKVAAFMLVGDLLACCFGGMPQPDAWMDVTMEDEGTQYLPYTPVLVKGTFDISREMPENGFFIGVYTLSGVSVSRHE